MRLRSHEEEKPSITPFDMVVEAPEDRHEPQRSKPEARSRRQGGAGRVIRSLVIGIVSIGIFSGIISSVTGVSLWEWLQGADFKKAYSMSNFSYARGIAADRVGDLAGATSALLTLSPDSSEAQELSASLFPKLLEKSDFKRAASVARFVKATQTQFGATMPSLLGTELGKRLGLAGALSFVQNNPDAAARRGEILPGLFSAVSTKELPALEKLTGQLNEADRAGAVEAIVSAYSTARKFPVAFIWLTTCSMAVN